MQNLQLKIFQVTFCEGKVRKKHAKAAIKDVGKSILNQSGSGISRKRKRKRRSKINIKNGNAKKHKTVAKRNRQIFCAGL